jgi:hypothetical protein
MYLSAGDTENSRALRAGGDSAEFHPERYLYPRFEQQYMHVIQLQSGITARVAGF